MAISISFPANKTFPLDVTRNKRLIISTKHIECSPDEMASLNFYRIEEIILTNKKSDKTSFLESEIEQMVNAIVSFLKFKSLFNRYVETRINHQRCNISFTEIAYRHRLDQLKETSDQIGLLWTTSKNS